MLWSGFRRRFPIPPATASDPRSTGTGLDQPTRLKLIDLRLDAYRMPPLTGRPVFIEAVTSVVPRIRSEYVPLSRSCNDPALCPDGHALVQLPGNHRSLFRTASTGGARRGGDGGCDPGTPSGQGE